MTSDAGGIRRIQEQCLELVFDVVPSRQIIFVLLFVVVANGVMSGSVVSPVAALAEVNVKELVVWQEGTLWLTSITTWILAFGLAILNESFLKFFISRSFAISKMDSHFEGWIKSCSSALGKIDETTRLGVVSSLKDELSSRLRSYRTQRVASELCFSAAMVVIYGSALLVYEFGIEKVSFSLMDFMVFMVAIIFAVLLHFKSIVFVIKKVMPIRIFLCAASGEILFFRGE